MKSLICYFSGAGNSRSIAHDLGRKLDVEAVLPIASVLSDPESLAQTTVLGLVFPVYFYGPPIAIKRFILETLRDSGLQLDYLFIIMTHGGMPFYAPSIVDRLLADAGYAASYVQGIPMVDTYIPLFRIPDAGKLPAKHTRIAKRVAQVAIELQRQEIKVATRLPFTRLFHSLWDNSLPLRADKDRSFIVTDACTGCGICAKTCPVRNILMRERRPEYQHACEQCLGCYHHCPEHAIRLTKKPLRGYSWYTPPKTFLPQEPADGRA